VHCNLSPEIPTCQSCETFFSGLSFVLQDFMTWVWKNNTDIHICQGYRGQADQDADFASGKSKLKYPNSAHNVMENGHPFSEAVDLFVLDNMGHAQFPVDRYQELNNQAILTSQPIIWGGSWETFKDEDHFQNSAWRSPNVPN
jgi:hypothetical protein